VERLLVEGNEYPVLPAAEVARQKGVDLSTVYRAVASGKLDGYQVGSAWLVLNNPRLDRWTAPMGRPKKPDRRRKPLP
jgi:excisionase family DNA binding protein